MNFYNSVCSAFIGLANIIWNVNLLRGIFEKGSNIVLPGEPTSETCFVRAF
jgi:hypothetical protein